MITVDYRGISDFDVYTSDDGCTELFVSIKSLSDNGAIIDFFSLDKFVALFVSAGTSLTEWVQNNADETQCVEIMFRM